MPLKDEKLRPVAAIVQARMSSTRLSAKVMREILGRPVIWHVINRLRGTALIDKIAVATSVDPADDVIERWCASNGVLCCRGSLDDVLDRYYTAALSMGAKTVVRITADCPLLDPVVVDRAIGLFADGGYDYVITGQTHPDGLDAEVFTVDALARAHKEARLSSQREHVTPFIRDNAGIFRTATLPFFADHGGMRWTVDDEKDLVLVTKIYEGLKDKKAFTAADVIDLLGKNPELLLINSATVRNEGYAKSLREDKLLLP